MWDYQTGFCLLLFLNQFNDGLVKQRQCKAKTTADSDALFEILNAQEANHPSKWIICNSKQWSWFKHCRNNANPRFLHVCCVPMYDKKWLVMFCSCPHVIEWEEKKFWIFEVRWSHFFSFNLNKIIDNYYKIVTTTRAQLGLHGFPCNRFILYENVTAQYHMNLI